MYIHNHPLLHYARFIESKIKAKTYKKKKKKKKKTDKYEILEKKVLKTINKCEKITFYIKTKSKNKNKTISNTKTKRSNK